jgi:hypothetical protein
MRFVGCALVVAACLVAHAPRAGADDYFDTTYEAAGLTPDSTWDAIFAAPRIFVRSPLVPFGGTFATVPLVFARGATPLNSPPEALAIESSPPGRRRGSRS